MAVCPSCAGLGELHSPKYVDHYVMGEECPTPVLAEFYKEKCYRCEGTGIEQGIYAAFDIETRPMQFGKTDAMAETTIAFNDRCRRRCIVEPEMTSHLSQIAQSFAADLTKCKEWLYKLVSKS